jgi:hypothetical protein
LEEERSEIVGVDLVRHLSKKKHSLVKFHLAEFGQYYRELRRMGSKNLIKNMYDFTMEMEEISDSLDRHVSQYEYYYIRDTLKPLVLEKLGYEIIPD